MSDPRRYLVTGGAGFIGSHLVAALLARGDEVVVIDDLSSGKRENIEAAVADADARSSGAGGSAAAKPSSGAGDRLQFIDASILDKVALGAAVEGVDAVLHQAAIPSVPRSFADPAGTMRANVEGTTLLLETCRHAGVRRVAMASSSSIYGDTPKLPKDESMVPTPMSPYALSKLAAEQVGAIFAATYGLEVFALRYFNVFGPRQDPMSQYSAVIPKFISRMLAGEPPVIFGDGLQSRDFTFIDDVVAANLAALEAGAGGGEERTSAGGEEARAAGGGEQRMAAGGDEERTAGGDEERAAGGDEERAAGGDEEVGGASPARAGDPHPVPAEQADANLRTAPRTAGVSGAARACFHALNIGGDGRHTLLDLVAVLNEILGTDFEPEHASPRPGDVRHSHAAIERAREVLDYRPAVGFVEGVRRTVASFRTGE